MDTKYPLDYALETERGDFRIITNGDEAAYGTAIYRRFPDGPHTELYREPATSKEDAHSKHDRVVEAVIAGTLP